MANGRQPEGIVGVEHCKAMIQDFGADPADLFDIDDIASENWV